MGGVCRKGSRVWVGLRVCNARLVLRGEELGLHTHLSYRALFCRCSGVEAFALHSGRSKDRDLLREGVWGMEGGGEGGLISLWCRQLSKSQDSASGSGKPG